ncbi:hypothetical protein MTO96_016147 [Rhipicephalus appendiculatus]
MRVAGRKIRCQVASSRSPSDEERVLAPARGRQPLSLAHKGKHGDDEKAASHGAAHTASSPANQFAPRSQEKEKRRAKRDQTLRAKGSECARGSRRQFSPGAQADNLRV